MDSTDAQKSDSLESDDSEVAKRKKIQMIMRDESLSDLDRRLKFLSVMNGSSNLSATKVAAPQLDDVIGCVHYDRNCNIVAPCCGKTFGCRVCHDEQTLLEHGPMNRFEVSNIICKLCHTLQNPSNKCDKCEVQFGEYFCEICRLWMSASKLPFHCSQCGFCRVGGGENFQHCSQCCMCLSVSTFQTHVCTKDKYKDNCPVCRDDIFSSRMASQELPCGHVIHAQCFRKLAHYDFRCPICKKTVVEKGVIKSEWDSRARDIVQQPMPSDLAKNVDILCYDCDTKSYQLAWHFLGTQCPSCESFNTVLINRDGAVHNHV